MRKLGNWLQAYGKYTSKSEPPTAFNLWCGISTIASCLQRKVVTDMGFFKLYPNMYIILVAPPGRCRKGVAIGMANSLLTNISGVKISSDAITKEALIQNIAGARNNFQIGTSIEVHSSLTIVSKELSVFLGKQNVELLALLTELFDSHDHWEYKTKHSGTDTIYGVWLNLLGATTPEWLSNSIPMTAIGGGFTSRVVFVVQDKKARSNARPVLTEEEKELKKLLKHDLEIISQLSGEYQWSDEGGKIHDAWYDTIEENSLMDDHRFQGYVERKDAHVVKLSMILAAAESDKLILEAHHIQQSITAIESLEASMVNAFGAVGKSNLSSDTDRIFEQIKRHKAMSFSAISSLNWRDVKPRELDEVLTSLTNQGIVERMRHDTTQEVYYKWTGKELE